VIFSGDIGQCGRPLVHDPAVFRKADYVVMESTYGDRTHEVPEDVLDGLDRIVNDTVKRGGNILIPTFAIDRAQAIMFHLGELVRGGRIPRLTIFVDSPMAVDVTSVYKRYKHLLDEQTQQLFRAGDHPFQFAGLHFVRSRSESRAVNSIRGSCIVMAGSGMCNGGRIKHHLRQNIDRPESTVVFTGFQARGTLGRQILRGDPQVRIHGRMYPVRACIERLYGMSAHADRDGLTDWLRRLDSPPRKLFLTHGESEAADSLAGHIRQELGWDATVPKYGDVCELDDH
jgi:metallo-beta-lactamase family protein